MELILLFVAALAAGAINALAGGGSFITLPALLFYGLEPTGHDCAHVLEPLICSHTK